MDQIRRRQILVAACALTAAQLVPAQSTQKTYRVAAILTTTPVAEMAGAEPDHPMFGGLVHELRALGYVEGRNLILERRSLEGRPERYADVVAELVGLKTDVIVSAGGSRLFNRAKGVWGNVPIVMFGSNNPVPAGLAASLGRPGGNLTGLLAISGPENEAKRLQLLKEAIPSVTRVAYLATREVWEHAITRAIRGAAPSLGIELLHAEHKPDDLEATFAAIERMHPDALFGSIGTETFGQRRQIVQFAKKARLPGSYSFAPMVEDGGLMSYSVDIADLGRRAAHYVDKILKGARPGDLPIEGPKRFALVINLGRARELGLTLPRSLLLRADRLIE
jgi:putative ABC transport system substrate-binding protein